VTTRAVGGVIVVTQRGIRSASTPQKERYDAVYEPVVRETVTSNGCWRCPVDDRGGAASISASSPRHVVWGSSYPTIDRRPHRLFETSGATCRIRLQYRRAILRPPRPRPPARDRRFLAMIAGRRHSSSRATVGTDVRDRRCIPRCARPATEHREAVSTQRPAWPGSLPASSLRRGRGAAGQRRRRGRGRGPGGAAPRGWDPSKSPRGIAILRERPLTGPISTSSRHAAGELAAYATLVDPVTRTGCTSRRRGGGAPAARVCRGNGARRAGAAAGVGRAAGARAVVDRPAERAGAAALCVHRVRRNEPLRALGAPLLTSALPDLRGSGIHLAGSRAMVATRGRRSIDRRTT